MPSEKAEKRTVRSPDFRYIPAESLGFSFGDNGAKIILGVEDMDGAVFEQMGVYLSNRTAKTLGFLLTEATKAFEEQTGTEIVVDSETLDGVSKALRESMKKPTD